MISPDTAATFEKFSNIVKRANQARSKDIRLDLADANMLVSEITNVLARLVQVLLVQANANAAENANVNNVKMDGGTFSKR